MKRYQDQESYIHNLVIFLVLGAVALLSVGALLVALWEDINTLHQLQQKPDWIRGAWAGGVLGLPTFLLIAWAMYNRDRLVADDVGNVWVRENSNVARFRWADVTRWWVVVVPNTGDEGPTDFRTIVVELAGGRTIRIQDSQKIFVPAFRESVPNREAVPTVEHN